MHVISVIINVLTISDITTAIIVFHIKAKFHWKLSDQDEAEQGLAKHCVLVGHVAGCAAFCILGGGVGGGGGGGGVVPLVGISRPPMTDAWQGPPASWGGHAYMHTWPAGG